MMDFVIGILKLISKWWKRHKKSPLEKTLCKKCKEIMKKKKSYFAMIPYVKDYRVYGLDKNKKSDRQEIQPCDKAQESPPDDAEIQYTKACAYLRLGKYDDAIKSYTEAIKIYSPSMPLDDSKHDEYTKQTSNFFYPYPALYNNRGTAKAKMHLYDTAIKDYDMAIDVMATYIKECFQFKKDGGLKKAASSSKNRIICEYAILYYNQGFAKKYAKKHTEAEQDFEKSSEFISK